jgi:tRNA(Arg) A34 adenosine deaminase TadA
MAPKSSLIGFPLEFTNKHRAAIELARKMAETSHYQNFRHGAVLTKGGRIISVANNSNNFSAFASRFYPHIEGRATMHAELSCILNIPKQNTEGATVYVVRINKNGELKMSKPCEMCEAAMRFVGIKTVIWTVDDFRIEKACLW